MLDPTTPNDTHREVQELTLKKIAQQFNIPNSFLKEDVNYSISKEQVERWLKEHGYCTKQPERNQETNTGND